MPSHQQQQRKYRWFGAARLSRAYFAVLLVLSLTEIALPILGIREAYLKEEFPATPNGKLVESELAVAQSCPGYAGMNIAAFIVAVLRFPVIVASFKYDSMAPKDYSVPAMDGAAIAADVGVWWKRALQVSNVVYIVLIVVSNIVFVAGSCPESPRLALFTLLWILVEYIQLALPVFFLGLESMFPVGIMASTSAVTGRGENDPIEHALVERGLGPAITLSPLESFNYKPASPDAPAIGLCLLCRVPYVAGDTLLRLPCSHVVHEVCARRRFMDNDACPQCGLNVEEMLNARRRSMDSFSLTAAPSSAVSGSTL